MQFAIKQFSLVLLCLLFTQSYAKEERINCPYKPGEVIKTEKNGWKASQAEVGHVVRSYRYAFIEDLKDINGDGEKSLICGYVYFDDKQFSDEYEFSLKLDDLTHLIPLRADGSLAKCHILNQSGKGYIESSKEFISGVKTVTFVCEE